ncbi:MAG TPA: hypothetical protein VF069_13000 [Streptosporangiaceae bacterium]
MSRYPRKIGRTAAERLLRGEPADPRHPDDLLAALLATAAAPAHSGELAGEEAAVAAFRQARAAGAFRSLDTVARAGTARERPWDPARARGWMRHPMRVVLVALTATTAGGVALAASSSGWSHDGADRTSAAPSAAASGTFSAPSAGRAPDRTPAAVPHPATVGLCRAYRAGAGDAPGKATEDPAFTSLIRAAGGREKVAGYCDAVLAAESKRPKSPKKSHPAGQPTPSSKSHESGHSGEPGSSDTGSNEPGSDRAAPSRSPGNEARPFASPAPTSTPSTDLSRGTASPQPLEPSPSEAAVARP